MSAKKMSMSLGQSVDDDVKTMDRTKAKFDLAKRALGAARVAAGADAGVQGLIEPDGWRWTVFADLQALYDVIVHDYKYARDGQKDQAWKARIAPLITGGTAGVGAVVAAVGAGVVKSGPWVWPVILIGIVVAIAGSLFGANSYIRDRNQKLRYLRIMHDLGDFAYLVLPTAQPTDVFQQLDNFRGLWESAGS